MRRVVSIGRNRGAGISLVWIVVTMTALCASASLAVDFGRYQVVKIELHRAADAAARAAASNISSPATCRQLARQWAGKNTADGKAVDVFDTTEDVVIGKWDPTKPPEQRFTPLSGLAEKNGNAVKVFARKTQARGNAVELMWTRMLPGNLGNCNAEVYSIAAVSPENYGVIGLNSITMSGNTTSSYWSDGSGSTANAGNIASNGNISLAGGSVINGNARGATVTGGTVTGTTGPLPVKLAFPNGDAGTYATVNDNSKIPGWALSGTNLIVAKNKNLPLPGGNYYFNNFSMATGSMLTFSGPATIYCYGNFTMSGQTYTAANLPKNLTVVMCPGPTGLPPGNVNIQAGAALYANIYAPQSNVTISGQGTIYGSVLGLTVNMNGGGRINYDLTLKGAGGIQLVK